MYSIDPVSKRIVTIALYLESKIPNSISEIWIDKNIVRRLKSNLPNSSVINKYIRETQEEIREVEDTTRRQYLTEVVKALKFQIEKPPQQTQQIFRDLFWLPSYKSSQR